MTGTRKELADAILALSYTEMMAFADSFSGSTKTDLEEDTEVDFTDRDYVADRFRWWAEGHLDYLEDMKSED